MEPYNTEEEQVEALRRWWAENGRSTMTAILLALATGFGWQAYQANEEQKGTQASDTYEAFLQVMAPGTETLSQDAVDLAEGLKTNFGGSTYAQFAALHLASGAVSQGNLGEAEAQLRWVLGKAKKGSDVSRITQLRLARVVAAGGDADQALEIIAGAGTGSYGASYASAKGDILFAAGRHDEAREAYGQAMALAALAGTGLPALQQKLQSLTSASTAAAASPLAAMEEPVSSPVSATSPESVPTEEQPIDSPLVETAETAVEES